MLHIIITSYKDSGIIRAVRSFLEQDIKEKYKIIIADPFQEVEQILKKQFPNEFKSGKTEFFLDSGEGKSYALNLILEKIYLKNTDDIIILTDGDVFVSRNSVSEILKQFQDKSVGCVTGKPVPLNSRKNMFGYFSHLAFAGIDEVRKKLSKEGKFLECSGYLFAFRNGILQGFPLETSEDSIIPFLFWKRNYKIKYVLEAEVFVHAPSTWKSYKHQKIRNIKGHENLNKLVKNIPRTKSFFNEIKHGTLFALKYPKNLKEYFFTFTLFLARFYIYFKAFYDIKIKKQSYKDAFR